MKTKLGREVAIKFLPGELAADQERVARFEREAKLLASLNHPNIMSADADQSQPARLQSENEPEPEANTGLQMPLRCSLRIPKPA